MPFQRLNRHFNLLIKFSIHSSNTLLIILTPLSCFNISIYYPLCFKAPVPCIFLISLSVVSILTKDFVDLTNFPSNYSFFLCFLFAVCISLDIKCRRRWILIFKVNLFTKDSFCIRIFGVGFVQ